MTIGIGALFLDPEYSSGVIIGADSKIVFSDGSTDSRSKVTLSLSPELLMLATANAAEDGNAANMIGGDIATAWFHAHRNNTSPATGIRRVMGRWHRSFGQSRVPTLEFLVGSVIVGKSVGLCYLQPPSTILWRAPFAIGVGARPVEPLLDLLSNPKTPLKSQLLLLAYLMFLAKQEEGSACGGATDVLVITKYGGYTFVTEMAEAESLAAKIHSSVQQCIREMVGAPEKFSGRPPFHQLQDELKAESQKLDFPSLKYLKKTVWNVKPKAKPQPKLGSDEKE